MCIRDSIRATPRASKPATRAWSSGTAHSTSTRPYRYLTANTACRCRATTAPPTTTGPTAGRSTTSQTGEKITYTVKSGDYLGKIAEKHGVGVSELKKWNGLTSNNIKVGQKLVIYTKGSAPASSGSSASSGNSASAAKGSSSYTVKSGDSFYSIAKNYPGVSAQNIMDYNNRENTNIRPGEVIKIPKF